MAGWAVLQTLAGTGDAYARAKQMKLEEAQQNQLLMEQLAGMRQNRALNERKVKIDEYLAHLAGDPTTQAHHYQHEIFQGPEGELVEGVFDPATGKRYDANMKPIAGVKPKPPAPKEVKYGPWQPPTKDAPIVGGMRMWQRDITDPLTGLPTGNKQFGLPNTSVLPNQRHLFKQETDQQGHIFLVPVIESSGKVVPNVGEDTTPGDTPAKIVKKLAGGAGAGSGKPSAAQSPTAPSGMPKGSIPVGQKPLSVAERKTLADVQQIAGRTASTLTLFAAHPELKNDNSPITPFLSWLEYSRGHYAPSDPLRLKLIQAAAFLSVKGAAPFTGLGRGKYVLEQVQKHLPQPNDSPKLFYEKLQYLNSLAKETRKAVLDPFAPPEGEGQVPREEGTIQR